MSQNTVEKEQRPGKEYWGRFCKLLRFNFLKDSDGNISRWENPCGTYIEQYEAAKLVDEMQEEINNLLGTIKQISALKLEVVPLVDNGIVIVRGGEYEQTMKICQHLAGEIGARANNMMLIMTNDEYAISRLSAEDMKKFGWIRAH